MSSAKDKQHDTDPFARVSGHAAELTLDGSPVVFKLPGMDELLAIADVARKMQDMEGNALVKSSYQFAGMCLNATLTDFTKAQPEDWTPVLIGAKTAENQELTDIVIKAMTLCGYKASAEMDFGSDSVEGLPADEVDNLEETLPEDPT